MGVKKVTVPDIKGGSVEIREDYAALRKGRVTWYFKREKMEWKSADPALEPDFPKALLEPADAHQSVVVEGDARLSAPIRRRRMVYPRQSAKQSP